MFMRNCWQVAAFGHESVAETPIVIRNEGNAVYIDKDMLEAQQRNIGDGESVMGFKVAIRADAGPTQGRRLLASMIEAEARGSIS